jgi:predicted outer membrane repeat protein
VLSTEGDVVISNSQFTSSGTSVFSNCALAISDSAFNAHVGTGDGGALRVNCNGSIERSEFHNNRAVHGGAIYVGNASTEVLMQWLKFVGNNAEVTGGAIAFETPATRLTITLRNSVFDSNRAWEGGAINLEGSVALIYLNYNM